MHDGSERGSAAESNGAVNSALTQRQIEIIRGIANGFSGKQIAHALGISRKTVDFHVANIKEKLDLRGVAGITRYAVRNGIVDAIEPMLPGEVCLSADADEPKDVRDVTRITSSTHTPGRTTSATPATSSSCKPRSRKSRTDAVIRAVKRTRMRTRSVLLVSLFRVRSR